MIQSKNDLKYYLECDRIALRSQTKKPRFMRDEIWRFQILLRKREYLNNCAPSNNIIHKLFHKFYELILHVKYNRLSLKLGFSIPLNVFGPGLSIAHCGTIVVAGKARVGSNCRIHEGVTIGATNGTSDAATIGDNVFIGSGAKIIGGVKISSNVQIAANCVVVKDIISDKGCTVGGVPAKVISSNTSELNLVKATELVNYMSTKLPDNSIK